MPELPDTTLPAEWPQQVRAAGALALIGVVWLLVLPVAAGAYLVLQGGAIARAALTQKKLSGNWLKSK